MEGLPTGRSGVLTEHWREGQSVTESIIFINLNMSSVGFFTSVINGYLPEPHASLLNGMVFGTSVKTTKLLYEQLKTVGLLHIVTLSGMNLFLLAEIIESSTRYFSKLVSCLI